MKTLKYVFSILVILSLVACGGDTKAKPSKDKQAKKAEVEQKRKAKKEAQAKTIAEGKKKEKAANKKNNPSAASAKAFDDELQKVTGISDAQLAQYKKQSAQYKADLRTTKDAKAKKQLRAKNEANLKSLFGDKLAAFKKLDMDWKNPFSVVKLKGTLGMTEEQISSFTALSDKYDSQLKGLNKKKNAAKITSILKQKEKEGLALLTDAQKTMLDEIKGKFKANQLAKFTPFQ